MDNTDDKFWAIIDNSGNEISLIHYLTTLAIKHGSDYTPETIKEAKELMGEFDFLIDFAIKNLLYEENGAIFLKDSAESAGGHDGVLFKQFKEIWGKPKKENYVKDFDN